MSQKSELRGIYIILTGMANDPKQFKGKIFFGVGHKIFRSLWNVCDSRLLGTLSETEATQVVLGRKDPNDLTCWSHATSLNSKIDEVRLLVHMHQPGVFSVTETW